MLLPLYKLPPPLSSKTLYSSSPLFFPSPTLSHQNPKPPKFPTRSSSSTTHTSTQTVSKTAIKRIAEKLRSLGFIEEDEQNSNQDPQPKTSHSSAGEIFLPFSHQFPKHRVGHTIDSSWSTPENPVPKPGSGTAITRFHELKSEVEKHKESAKREERVPTLAELTIPVEELRRLRGIGIGLKKKLNVGKAGITEGIVNGIHERWRRLELVKIRCEDLCRMNMKRTHDLLERKTGGMVIWRSGSSIILYRGANYKYPYFLTENDTVNNTSDDELSSESSMAYRVDRGKENNLVRADGIKSGLPSSFNRMAHLPLVNGVGSPNKVRFQLPGEAQLAEEADCMLDGLGPRFTDWWGYDPVPVDADLLPAVVPGYRRSFRLLPYGVQPKLTDDEMTTLRRLGRPLPCHFALGRNRNLQGLAASMVKLWEKCEIAKIAVKRGVQNTNSEMMAEELKRLTGGTLISRDREFITFYRGKDFLPPAVSTAIAERRKHRAYSEKQCTEQSPSLETMSELHSRTSEPASVDELQETNDQKEVKLVPEQRKLRSKDLAIKRTSTKLSMALEKKAKAEKILSELEKVADPRKPEVDREGITEEERYMLKKVGLRMKPFVPLGRRGVFDGTVENMHLHWKYRELVKLISNDRCIENVHAAARTLEAESGGILVAVERVNRAYAIIVYRGKNYKRPVDLRPHTLLNKKQAMKLSIEAQRRESLKLHVLRLTENISKLKLQLVKDETQMNLVQSTEHKRTNTEFETNDQPGLVEYSHNQENTGSVACTNDQGASEGHGNDSTPLYSNYCVDASRYSKETMLSDKPVNSFSHYDESAETELKSLSELALKETDSNTFLDEVGERDDDNLTSLPMNLQLQDASETHFSVNELIESSIELDKTKFELPVHRDDVEKGLDLEVPFRATPLSNRDRLVLRKQALKMKKRPVLAIGRNNVVTGVAKAIKTHFQKNPLAIVNVKGRAQGTSIQEVVFKLEQATGAVLVSQEPNKVILYRGWVEGEEPGRVKDTRKVRRTSTSREGSAREMVSPQLIEAIRLECGLQSSQEELGT